MFWSTESAYEEIRRTQRELQERAARARLLARARREAAQARQRSPGRSSWTARLRAARQRP